MEKAITIPPPQPPIAPYAGFYANMVDSSKATKIVVCVEFFLLLLMGIFMYGVYLRERRQKSKIKFNSNPEIKPSIFKTRQETR